MKKSTIDRLNKLNQEFYNQVAENFHETRAQAWAGWEQLLQLDLLQTAKENKTNLFVLDLGCGNGRFAQFLQKNQLNIRYLGIDANQKLLNLGLQQADFQAKPDDWRLEEFDVIQDLLEAGENGGGMDFGQFDVAVAFGFLHHLPSFWLRQKFLKLMAKQIDVGGLVIVTAWRFDRDENLLKRQKSLTEIGIEKDEIEADDYLLDWQRGTKATRYCHLVKLAEMEKLMEGSGLTLIKTFSADGKSGNLNDYYIFKREI